MNSSQTHRENVNEKDKGAPAASSEPPETVCAGGTRPHSADGDSAAGGQPQYEYIETVDEAFVRRERAKARELRQSSWWRQQLGKGVCYFCEQRFAKDQLTMEHLIPVSRGGRTTKKNIVVSCKQCNSLKKNLTVAELRLREMK